MGITVVFGTSIATIFGVFLIPMMFIIVETFGHSKKSFSVMKETVEDKRLH